MRRSNARNPNPRLHRSPTRLYLPQIMHSKISRIRQRNLPPDKEIVRSLTQVNINYRRPADREKKFTLRAWETDDTDEDGITAFVRRQSIWESKRGTRKQPEILSADFFHPVSHQCPCVDDFVAFKKESLHRRFHPKDRANNKRSKGLLPAIPFPSNGAQPSSGYGVITSIGCEQKDMAHYIGKDFDKREIETYREKKHGDYPDYPDTSRSAPVVDMSEQARRVTGLNEPRGMTYLNIKKLLKFTTSDRKRLKIEDEEDEGYSSKTSSAETKEHERSAEGGGKNNLTKSKLYSSMINVSELPFDEENQDRSISAPENDPRIKFSYTHQPTILQLPDPNVQLIPERLRFEKKIEKEDISTYARIKRAKELNRYNDVEQHVPLEDSTVYNIDTLKPTTLILRKISIQDADKSVTTVIPHTWSSQVNYDRAVSTSPIRMSSRASRVGSALSRIGSGISRSCSSQSQPDPRSYAKQRPKSKYSKVKGNEDSMHNDNENLFNTPDDMELQANYPALEKQATSYCIGDLLPAVDKSIYTNQPFKAHTTQIMETKTISNQVSAPSDGYVLLQRGTTLLSTGFKKKTLGPPPFRPNQTRYPLIRNLTVVVEKAKQMDLASDAILASGSERTTANASKTGTIIQTPGTGSDKGLRTQLSPDKETKRKLKEAFTKFYQNRPKEIGKEFRRTQTMWQT